MSDTAEQTRLMKVKRKMNKKRPKFSQFESWRLVRIKEHWRRPKGLDNKMKQNRKGWPKSVNVGWRSPKSVRDLHPSGKEEVKVYNVGDLVIIDPGTQVARIGGSVGLKKRISIIREARRLNIKVLNPGKASSVLDAEDTLEEELEAEEVEEELREDDSESQDATETGTDDEKQPEKA